ncbi:MAG: hypothetical protein K9H49_19490 [Bacteroidales bacterium]|nr:hypothetical protein [Bacteroidales bacterium]MCF8391937.1 hypothetical protein [Bacteroidales bacterium]
MNQNFKKYKNIQRNLISLIRYNMRIVFGGKFVYFILASFAFFLLIGTISAFDDNYMGIQDVYGLLIFPAILLVFYPSAFGIQNDADQRTLEIIFGIPDYRYKVWLIRILMVQVIAFLFLFPFAAIAHYALVSIPIFAMVTQLMFLVLFISTLGFTVSTLVKSGNATAVILIVLGLVFLILSDELDESKWNIFLNPFNTPSDMNEIIWIETVRQNRIILIVSSIVFLLLGLMNLQNREKFLR